MSRGPDINEGQILKDKSGLEVKVERIDTNKRIRFSVVGNQATTAGPGEMSHKTFVSRFCPTNDVSKPHVARKKAA